MLPKGNFQWSFKFSVVDIIYMKLINKVTNHHKNNDEILSFPKAFQLFSFPKYSKYAVLKSSSNQLHLQ